MGREKRRPQVSAGSRVRSGLPPGAKGARSGSGPLAFFPSRHEQGPACRHSPGAAGARPGQCGHCLGAANPAGGQVGGTRRRRRASRSGRGGLPGRGHRPGGPDTRLPGGLAASPPRGRKWRGAGRRRRERRGSDIKRCLRNEEREGKKRQERGEKEDAGRGEAGHRARAKTGGKEDGQAGDKAGREGRSGCRGDRQTDVQSNPTPGYPGSLYKELKFTVSWRDAAPKNPAESAQPNHTRGFA